MIISEFQPIDLHLEGTANTHQRSGYDLNNTAALY